MRRRPRSAPSRRAIEGERRVAPRPFARSGRAARRRRRIAARLPARAAPRAAMPSRFQASVEQLVLVEAEQRALQHGRQRQIVLRQQQRVGEHHQVHHRDVLGQHQPVGAGDRDACVLQRADDRLEQRAALAHQHQHVAWRAAAAARRSSAATVARRSCAPAAPAGSSPSASSNGASQASISRFSSGLISAQISTRPGAASRQRLVHGARRRRRSGRRCASGRANTVSTASSTFGAGAERVLELHVATKSSSASPQSAARSSAACSSNSRGAAPWNEKIDCFSSPTAKIVRVAVARAGAGEEFGRPAPDDLPLLRARVLRLVDQHMVDAAVELVVHPGGAIRRVEQRERLVDQVVVVEQAAPVLLGADSARSPRRRW